MRRPKELRRLEDRVFTVPNALSLARLFIVPVVVALLLDRADGLAAALFVLASVTDFLGGRLARRAAPTRLGQILDPLADRLMLSSVAVVLAVRGLLPAWAVAILVGRDLLALIGSAVVGSKIRVNRVGKAATAVLMGAIALVVLIPGTVVGEIMFYAGFGLSIVAGLMYLRSVRRILGGGDCSMKASIMAGGQEMRLRLLTSNQPKPMIGIANPVVALYHLEQFSKRMVPLVETRRVLSLLY